MFAVITTEEYKELLEAKKDNENFLEDLYELAKRVLKAEESLTEVLQLLTKGGRKPEIGEQYESWDILTQSEIAKYINEHYLADGKLQFEKVEKVEEKENTNE